jgi:uncharacterized protein (TIGR03118 family)
MQSHRTRSAKPLALIAFVGLSPIFAGCSGSGSTAVNQNASARFQQANLVSDIAGLAATKDPNLVNPWGIAFSQATPFWIADNNAGKATTYNGNGAIQPVVVSIASPTAPTGGTPTGEVVNGTSDFALGDGNPALFIFATEDGTIVAWSGYTGSTGVVVADRSAIPAVGGGAVYKGLATGSNSAGNFLYAANFRTGTVDVFDKNFRLVLLPGSFTDLTLPPGYAPFGIQNIAGDIFVSYAKQDAPMHDPVDGPGSGLIDVFDSSGNFKRRFAAGTAVGGTVAELNSPWGMTVAPAGFGAFAGDLLVGNFGDGHISAFNLTTGAIAGQLQDTTGTKALAIPGLWGLAIGNGGTAGTTGVLYFTAGIGDPPLYTTNRESHGLFGSLKVVAP